MFTSKHWTVSAGCDVAAYPLSRADGLVGGPGAGAEVELLDWETLVVEADAVCSAGRPVLHVSQVSVSIDQHMATAGQETGRSQLSTYVYKPC